jgi:mannose-6-phosphate isomerase-like protein (cupin superfamily)
MFEVSIVSDVIDEIAPDTSEIRLLSKMKGGSVCHCTLPVGRTSIPVKHRRIEEIWYILGGEGEIWRSNQIMEMITAISSGMSLTIPPETSFQFRSTGTEPLTILIVTMPPWPGPEEAVQVNGIWPQNIR